MYLLLLWLQTLSQKTLHILASNSYFSLLSMYPSSQASAALPPGPTHPTHLWGHRGLHTTQLLDGPIEIITCAHNDANNYLDLTLEERKYIQSGFRTMRGCSSEWVCQATRSMEVDRKLTEKCGHSNQKKAWIWMYLWLRTALQNKYSVTINYLELVLITKDLFTWRI